MSTAISFPAGLIPSNNLPNRTNKVGSKKVEQQDAIHPHILTKGAYLLLSLILFWGWHFKETKILTPKTGIGYWLGILGACLMLSLILYPLRKKKSGLRWLGSVRAWFRFHIVAGIIGPVMVLFHANFNLGSLNSRVVLGSTLLVACSGFIGRYIYAKIHYGLHGRRIKLSELTNRAAEGLDGCRSTLALSPEAWNSLSQFCDFALRPSMTLRQSILHLVALDVKSRGLMFSLMGDYKRNIVREARQHGWSNKKRRRHLATGRRVLRQQIALTIRVAEFTFYERLFALWHVFHMPLFLMLILAGTLHVIAVTMY